jgi:hypothetical protein
VRQSDELDSVTSTTPGRPWRILQKSNGLFYELEEIGLNKKLGMTLLPTWSINIGNFIATQFRLTSRPPFATSMRPQEAAVDCEHL